MGKTLDPLRNPGRIRRQALVKPELLCSHEAEHSTKTPNAVDPAAYMFPPSVSPSPKACKPATGDRGPLGEAVDAPPDGIKDTMGRRMCKGARNARMPGADRVRCRASRLALGAEGPDGETPIVPAYLLGQKKNHNGRKGQLNARRSLMKGRMEMKTGVTTFGCMPGVLASIVYPLTQVENELLNGMGALSLEDEPVALEAN